MRIIDIAIFMMVFQIIGGAVATYMTSFGLPADTYIMHSESDAKVQESQQKVENILNSAEAATSSGDPLTTGFNMMYQWAMQAISALVNAAMPLLYYVAWIPLLMQQMGVPAEIAWPFFLIYTALEAVGFLQIIAGRNLKEYD